MQPIETLDELIETLQAIREARGDVDVRIGDQPNYPFECSCGGVVFDATIGEAGAVILLEGEQLASGKRAWWDGADIEKDAVEY